MSVLSANSVIAHCVTDGVQTSELIEMSHMYDVAEMSEWDEFDGSGAYVHTTLFGRHVVAEVLRRDSHGSVEVVAVEDGLIFYVRIDQIVPVTPEESASIERSEAYRMREKARYDRSVQNIRNHPKGCACVDCADAWVSSAAWEKILMSESS